MATNRFNKSTSYRPGNLIPFLDPLAQSFLVLQTNILTKVQFYFAQKDSTLPVKIEIRKMENGVPGNSIVPYSQTSVTAANINVSANATTPTTFTFPSPVLVEPGEYALCLSSDSLRYKLWISQLGELDITTNQVITKQPSLGVLFKSSNSTTWTPDQLQDLKFILYRAKFSPGITASVELWPGEVSARMVPLGNNPFEIVPDSREMKVYHTNHGLRNGSYTLNSLTSLPNFGSSDSNVSTSANIFGVYPNVISGITQLVSNVKNDSYTVQLTHTPTVSAVTRFGGPLVYGLVDTEFNTLYPAIGAVVPSSTSVVQKIKTTSFDYVMDSSYTTIDDNDNDFNNLRVIPSNTNREKKMGNAMGMAFRLELGTSNQYVAPLIDTEQLGMIVVKNIINNPTYESEHLSREKVSIYYGNNIGFTNLTSNTGSINLNTSIAKANAVSIVKGTQIEIKGSNNTGNVRVLDIQNNGQNVIVYGTIVNENLVSNSTANVSIINGTQFIFEEAARGGSATSKYITRQINFINPSTAFKLFLDVSKPIDADIKLYYRTSAVGETASLSDKEFKEITGITISNSLGGEFFEIEKIIEDIPQFDGIQLKIVFLSSNTSNIPKCKNLRIVAFA